MESVEAQIQDSKLRSKSNGRNKELEAQYAKLENMVLESAKSLKRRVESVENIHKEHETAKRKLSGQIYDWWSALPKNTGIAD